MYTSIVPSPLEAKAGGYWLQRQLYQFSETMSQNKNNKRGSTRAEHAHTHLFNTQHQGMGGRWGMTGTVTMFLPFRFFFFLLLLCDLSSLMCTRITLNSKSSGLGLPNARCVTSCPVTIFHCIEASLSLEPWIGHLGDLHSLPLL